MPEQKPIISGAANTLNKVPHTSLRQAETKSFLHDAEQDLLVVMDGSPTVQLAITSRSDRRPALKDGVGCAQPLHETFIIVFYVPSGVMSFEAADLLCP